jgi:thiol-disulfide isomerase/thioredoxin
MNNFVNMNKSSTSFLSRIIPNYSKMSTTTIIILLAIILFIILAVYYYYNYVSQKLKTSYHTNNEGYTNSGPSKQAELMLFYADWCPHCKHAKPLWSELQSAASAGSIKTSDGSAVEIVDPIDGSDADALGLPYKGFPTFVLKKGGQMSRCDADRSVGAWSSWLQQQ